MSARVVYKYPLPNNDVIQLELPTTSKAVHFGAQHDTLMVWVDQPADQVAGTETHEFLVRGTGHPYSALGWRHIGSTLVDGGMFVFHLFGRVI